MAEESMSSPRGHLAVSASPLPEQASPKSTPTPQQFRTPPSSEQAARELDFLERRRATQQIPTHAPTSRPADNQESDVHADVSRGRAQVPVAERLAKNLGDRIGDAAQSFKKWLKATPKPSAKSPIATRRRKTPPEDETPSSRILLLDTPDNYTSVKPAVRQKPSDECDNPGGGEATDEESSSARDTTNMLTWVEQRPRALFTNSPTGNDSPSKEKSDDVLFPVARKRRRRGNDSPSEEKSDDVLFPVARKRRRRGANPLLEEPALFPGGDEGSAHSQEAQRRAPPPPPPPPRRAPPPPRQSPPPQPPPRRRRGSRQSFSMSDDGLSGDDGRGGNGGGGLHNGDVMSAMKRRVRKRDPASRIYLSVDYIPRAVWRRITRKAGIERIRKEAFNDLYGLADAFLENVLVNVNMLMWAKKKNVVTSKDISYVLNDIHNFKTSDFP